MPLIQSVEPDLRALIAYIVAGARERRVTLNRTRLVKLLYLVDVESVRTRREPVTGVAWVFLDFGPHAGELVDVLEDLERRTALYRAMPDDAPDGEDWLAATRRTVDSVIERFAALPVNALLDHVYFRTGPMAGAQRGRLLDMSRARDDAGPRRAPALRAPARADGVEERLAGWRASTARRLGPLALDPSTAGRVGPSALDPSTAGRLEPLALDPGARLLADPGDDFEAGRVRGRLHVPPGSEL
ncbi:MAG: hypothetical protein QOG56_2493 [Solirubrobacteraceae bacterium]|nr:hypothetical protein [Solirubrobacteraceae bacterium]